MSLSTKVLLGMALGILVGVFFGEEVAFFQTLGEAFIRLLQMSVLPYMTISLILGLGSLKFSEALTLAKQCGLLLLGFWIICLAVVLLMPLAFPDWESASFFSTSLVQEKQEFDFLKLYIPANPFQSMANTVVPAVVLFSIALGVALIGVEKKQGLLETLSSLLSALTIITNFVVGLAPIGVFAIAASAAGTMNIEDLGRLQVYLVTYMAVTFVLTFWILPGLVAALTPLTYRQVLGPTRDALVTAFATGNLLVVLPILAQRSKELLRLCNLTPEDVESSVDVIVPASFNFPNLGKLLSLSFVLFAGWFSGSEVSVAQYPAFAISGLVSFFGEVIVALPFLLDLMRIPADMFQLFVTVDVLSGRFGSMLAAMNVLALALLGTCAMNKRLTLHWGRMVRYIGVSVLLIVVAIGGSRLFFALALDPEYTKYQSLIEMDLLNTPAKVKVSQSSPTPSLLGDQQQSRLDVIRERGVLRVGYFGDSLPFAFKNAAAKLVGFDIEMAHLLAKELNVAVEFLRLKKEQVDEKLIEGYCDIIIPGIPITPNRAVRFALSQPYFEHTLAFVVRDYRREEFTDWETIKQMDNLKVGVPGESRYYLSLVRKNLPRATVVSLASPREFFRSRGEKLDALVQGAEGGSAWTLIYPQYTVAVPFPKPVHVPAAYAMPRGEHDMVKFVNTWLELKKKDKTLERLFDHWILGRGAEKKEPRWSVIRNVLHWID